MRAINVFFLQSSLSCGATSEHGQILPQKWFCYGQHCWDRNSRHFSALLPFSTVFNGSVRKLLLALRRPSLPILFRHHSIHQILTYGKRWVRSICGSLVQASLLHTEMLNRERSKFFFGPFVGIFLLRTIYQKDFTLVTFAESLSLKLFNNVSWHIWAGFPQYVSFLKSSNIFCSMLDRGLTACTYCGTGTLLIFPLSKFSFQSLTSR